MSEISTADARGGRKYENRNSVGSIRMTRTIQRILSTTASIACSVMNGCGQRPDVWQESLKTWEGEDSTPFSYTAHKLRDR